MNVGPFVLDYLEHVESVLRQHDLSTQLERAVELLETVKRSKRRLMLAGNGASASLASHFAVDFTKQAGIPAIAFNDAPLITAYGNDYGFEHWIARAIDHHGREGDCAILISSSGSSKNVLHAADRCKETGISVITFSGFEAANPLRARGDINLWASSRAYNVIEGVHGIWLGMLCDLLIGCREYDVQR